MKNLIFAALTALSVSACSTVKNPASSSNLKADKVSSDYQLTDVALGMTESSFKDGKQSGFNYATPDQSGEKLLYGAMTKFELMSFVEIISAGNQQAVLEQTDIVTVFAPNNSAFEYAGRPAKTDTTEFLQDHMIAGRFDLQTLKTAIVENSGPLALRTLSGRSMTFYLMDGKVKLSGANGILATITQSDMVHSNGVMHQINHVLLR